MPLHLRSGLIKNAPQKKYKNAFAIYKEEKQGKYPNLQPADLVEKLREDYEKLDEKTQDQYYEKLEKYEIEYKEELLKFYGHSKNDIQKFKSGENIPNKPLQPLSLYYRFYNDHVDKVKKQNNDMDSKEIRKIISTMYEKLTEQELLPYEKQYNEENEEYQKELDKWNKKYGNKMKEHQEFINSQFYKQQNEKDTFVYEEFQKQKRAKKMTETIPNGSIEEKKQIKKDEKQNDMKMKKKGNSKKQN